MLFKIKIKEATKPAEKAGALCQLKAMLGKKTVILMCLQANLQTGVQHRIGPDHKREHGGY